jgi:hypothetical protein
MALLSAEYRLTVLFSRFSDAVAHHYILLVLINNCTKKPSENPLTSTVGRPRTASAKKSPVRAPKPPASALKPPASAVTRLAYTVIKLNMSY